MKPNSYWHHTPPCERGRVVDVFRFGLVFFFVFFFQPISVFMVPELFIALIVWTGNFGAMPTDRQ